MSIILLEYTFDGPTSTDRLENRSGVYVIICPKKDKKYSLIDVGESATVKSRVENHDRKDCWEKNCQGTLAVAVYYTPNLQQPGRIAIEQKIRSQYQFSCGER
jgi:hypothetical protein